MCEDKKKQVSPEELIQIATEQKLPPLYNTREIDGIIVKTYPFIRGHSKIYNQDLPEKDIEQKDYSLLAVYKNELENQLELNRKNCVGQYNHILVVIRNWLNKKFNKIGRPFLKVSGEERKKLEMFVSQINTIVSWIMMGVEIDTIKEDLASEEYYKPIIKVERLINGKDREPVIFDVSELLDQMHTPLQNIERVVSRSVDLYFEYVNIHSKLYQFDLENFISEQYGIHQKNSIWVKEKWNEVRNNKPSDRQADIEVQELYEKEFDGLKISTSQIQRFTGRQ